MRISEKTLFIAIIVSIVTVSAGDFDPLLLSSRSMYSASGKALGDAGIAYPNDILCGMVNPALVCSYFAKNRSKKVMISTGYGRDSIFDRHIIPFGVALGSPEGGLGFFYRGMFGERKNEQNEIVLNLSGMISGAQRDGKNNLSIGQVDFGANIRYEWYTWNRRILVPLDSISAIDNGSIKQKRLLLDIGLYQSNVSSNLDFALTMRDIIGYCWTEENPVLTDSLKKEYNADGDTVNKKVPYYLWINKKSRDWVEGRYKALTLGIVYHFNQGSSVIQVDLPMDFEILGLYDRHTKNRYIFRGGISAKIINNFTARLGYSRTPGPIKSGWKEIKNINVFTGGAGISFNPVVVDFYLSNETFGTTLSCAF